MSSNAKARLAKELSLLDVYAIATGTTLSAGFFLLPAIAAAEAGPAMVLSYILASVPMVPAMFSAVELATAMPRAGGPYYFLDRSLGPLAGVVGGFGTWLSLVLKTTFALIGMGAYLELLLPALPALPVAAGFAVFFGTVNLLGAASTGRAQLVLVAGLLTILAWFIGAGTLQIDSDNFEGFFDAGLGAILSTSGLVYVSYGSITKVASVAEEVRDPERNLPLGVFLALGTAVAIYAAGTLVMIGIVPAAELAKTLTPVALVAESLGGSTGVLLVSIAAMLAFASVANAGIMSSSRYPLAMSRDHLLPGFLARLGKRGTPVTATLVTVGAMLFCLLALDVGQIAKLASTFQLLVFAGLSLAVIVMRESRIESYDPGYRVPWYPWLPLVGIATSLYLIAQMGFVPIASTGAVIVLGIAWYAYYARARVARYGAIFHVFERLGRQRFEGLDRELRGILKEKGLRDGDPFDEVIARAFVVDQDAPTTFERLVDRAANLLAQRIPVASSHLAEGFLNGTRTGATPVAGGAALPHIRLSEARDPEMVIVRGRSGVRVEIGDVFGDRPRTTEVVALFFLVSPEDDPSQHLRLLAQLAGRIDQEDFLTEWNAARHEAELKEVLLRNERYLTVSVRDETPAADWANHALRDIDLPDGCLVALVRRGTNTVVPDGRTELRKGDRLTILGSTTAINELRQRLGA